MKIKPEIYAKALIDAIFEKKMSEKDIAKKFWFALQRNGQYKDLKGVLERLNQEYAERTNSVYAKIYSAKELDEKELQIIESRLEKRYKEKILIENIVRKSMIAGVIVKVSDREIDLSIEGRVSQMKQLLKK